MDILAGLALNGSSSTRELATYIIKRDKDYTQNKVKFPTTVPKLQYAYYRRIAWSDYKKSKKTKLTTKNPTLLSLFYVQEMEQIKTKHDFTYKYFLTLKGCLVALGFKFTNKELRRFINNASRIHIYFAFLEKIIKETSNQFVRKIFIEPIIDSIEKELFVFKKNDFIRIYSGNISTLTGLKFYEYVHNILEESVQNDKDINDMKEMKFAKAVMNYALYDKKIEVWYRIF